MKQRRIHHLNDNIGISRDYFNLKCNEIIAITEARIEHMRSELLRWFISGILIQTVTIVISIVVTS